MNSTGPYLVIIAAPSGGGKTTLCQKLIEDFPSLKLSISTTTRLPRGSEVHGVDYFYSTRDEFEKLIQKNRFVEWAEVHGNYYGTSRDVIEQNLKNGYSTLLDIDIQGAESLKKLYPEQCYLIFISPPSLEELEFRLRARGTDTEKKIQERLQNAKVELEASRHFDRVIVNDSLNRAYSELKNVIETHLRLPLKSEKASDGEAQ